MWIMGCGGFILRDISASKVHEGLTARTLKMIHINAHREPSLIPSCSQLQQNITILFQLSIANIPIVLGQLLLCLNLCSWHSNNLHVATLRHLVTQGNGIQLTNW